MTKKEQKELEEQIAQIEMDEDLANTEYEEELDFCAEVLCKMSEENFRKFIRSCRCHRRGIKLRGDMK